MNMNLFITDLFILFVYKFIYLLFKTLIVKYFPNLYGSASLYWHAIVET